MKIQSFFDDATATITYIIIDENSNKCAILDPVLDYDQVAGRTTTTSADTIIEYIEKQGLEVEWVLESHIHADHLTASDYIKTKLGGKSGVSDKITDVLQYWVPVFNTGDDTPLDGSQFDVVFADGDSFKIGELEVTVMHTPGHTPACVSYKVEDTVFVGDAIFMPYVGTARADFPGGDAEVLHDSIQKILSLPDDTRIFTCHDYPPKGDNPAWESTVAEQKQKNILINDSISKDDYIKARNKKDSKLPPPKLLLPSIQFNLRAGKHGKPENNGTQYIKIPINKL